MYKRWKQDGSKYTFNHSTL